VWWWLAQFCMAHTLRAFRKDMTDAQFYNEGIEKVSNYCLMRIPCVNHLAFRAPGHAASELQFAGVCNYAQVSVSCA